MTPVPHTRRFAGTRRPDWRRSAAAGALIAAAGLAPGAARADDQPASQAPAEQEQPALLGSLAQAFGEAAAKVERSIVAVGVEREPERPRRGVPAYTVRPGSPASGILLEGGHVLTSSFHIEGARAVFVRFADGTRREVDLLGRDDEVELALLKVKGELPKGVEPFAALREDLPAVGSFVVNVGRGPHGPTVNTGVVSAIGRFQGAVLQTDAAINYGNLGGAAVDLDGRLLGMVVRLNGRTGVNSGVGFVTPTARIVASLASMKAGKVVEKTKKPFLGVRFGKEYMDPPGLELAEVVAGSAAAQGGLQKGDILERFDGRTLKDWDSLSTAIAMKRPGETVEVEGRRGEGRFKVNLTLGERTDEE